MAQKQWLVLSLATTYISNQKGRTKGGRRDGNAAPVPKMNARPMNQCVPFPSCALAGGKWVSLSLSLFSQHPLLRSHLTGQDTIPCYFDQAEAF